MAEIVKQRRTRADALRNRELILNAAVGLLVEDGPAVALEAIARRAGVGIATLYRHFPDRTVLLRQVAVGVLRQSAAASKAALAEEPDAFSALSRFLHNALDIGISVIMPIVTDQTLVDDELDAVRKESRDAFAALVKAAHDEGSLRPDVGPGDLVLLIIRMTPPLPVDVSFEDNHVLSHRQLELALDGLLRFVATHTPIHCRFTNGRAIDPAVDTGGRSTTNGS
jgi:AcrR family transcriptional regulator